MQKIYTRNTRFYYSILLSVIILGVFSAFILKHPATQPVEADRNPVTNTEQLRKLVTNSKGTPTDQDLLSLEQKFPKSRTGSLARFLRAYLHYTKKDFVVSSQLFDEEFIKHDTIIGDYALYYQARSYSEIGEYNKAKGTFLKLAQNYPNSLFAREGENVAGELTLTQLNDPKGAIKLLSKLVDNKDPSALLITAQSHEKLSQTEQAINSYRKLYYEVPQSSKSSIALTRLNELGYSLPELDKQGYELSLIRADQLFQAGLFAPAIESYQKLKTSYPDFRVKPANDLHLGISLYKLNRFREAITLLQNVPSSEKEFFLDARYYLANSFLKQKLMGQFVDTANQVLSLKPPPERAAELLSSLVEYYENLNESQARGYRNQLIKNYPDSKEADKVSYKTAWKLHTEKRYLEASDALVEHLANIPNPEFRGQSIFWAACNAERAGQLPKAMALYGALLKRYKY
ncbi:MAG: soluble lytic murein transglycosylase, partial [bacterium]